RAAIQHELAARHRRAARVAVAGFREAEIDIAVVHEIRVDGDVAEAALSSIIDLGYARDIDRFAAEADELQNAPLLGDEDAAIGEEGECPRLFKDAHLGGSERFAGFCRGGWGGALAVARGRAVRAAGGEGERGNESE